MRMIAPYTMMRTGSGARSTMSRLLRTVRMNAPTMVPPYPPRPPKMEVPPITAAATDGAPVTQGWRDQLHAALIGLGYATREADEAVTAVAPQAEAAEGTPQVGQLLKAALQTLNRAR